MWRVLHGLTHGISGVTENLVESLVYLDVDNAHGVSVQHCHGFADHVRVPQPQDVVSATRHQYIDVLVVVETLTTLDK